MTPEVRLSPDGVVAIKWPGAKFWDSRHPACHPVMLADDDVSDWTPLLPASSEDGAA